MRAMAKRSTLRLAILLAAVTAISGPAVARTAGPASPKLRSLRVVPQNPTLWGANASHHFLVLGTYSDGIERDVTGQSVFLLSNPGVARIDSSGRVTGLVDGKAVLTARFDGQSVTTRVEITGSQQSRPF